MVPIGLQIAQRLVHHAGIQSWQDHLAIVTCGSESFYVSLPKAKSTLVGLRRLIRSIDMAARYPTLHVVMLCIQVTMNIFDRLSRGPPPKKTLLPMTQLASQ
jgi:hypothetical protein